MENNVNQVVDGLTNLLEETFNQNQKRDNQYVVEYRKVSDDSLLGYHLSTFCQVGQERLGGKRYAGDNPYTQLQIIHNNLRGILSVEDNGDGVFDKLKRDVKNKYFKGLVPEDIYLNADYLEKGIEPQKFVLTK